MRKEVLNTEEEKKLLRRVHQSFSKLKSLKEALIDNEE